MVVTCIFWNDVLEIFFKMCYCPKAHITPCAPFALRRLLGPTTDIEHRGCSNIERRGCSMSMAQRKFDQI